MLDDVPGAAFPVMSRTDVCGRIGIHLYPAILVSASNTI